MSSQFEQYSVMTTQHKRDMENGKTKASRSVLDNLSMLENEKTKAHVTVVDNCPLFCPVRNEVNQLIFQYFV